MKTPEYIPAFSPNHSSGEGVLEDGMQLRDYIATHVAPVFLKTTDGDLGEAARMSYKFADEMLVASGRKL